MLSKAAAVQSSRQANSSLPQTQNERPDIIESAECVNKNEWVKRLLEAVPFD